MKQSDQTPNTQPYKTIPTVICPNEDQSSMTEKLFSAKGSNSILVSCFPCRLFTSIFTPKDALSFQSQAVSSQQYMSSRGNSLCSLNNICHPGETVFVLSTIYVIPGETVFVLSTIYVIPGKQSLFSQQYMSSRGNSLCSLNNICHPGETVFVLSTIYVIPGKQSLFSQQYMSSRGNSLCSLNNICHPGGNSLCSLNNICHPGGNSLCSLNNIYHPGGKHI